LCSAMPSPSSPSASASGPLQLLTYPRQSHNSELLGLTAPSVWSSHLSGIYMWLPPSPPSIFADPAPHQWPDHSMQMRLPSFHPGFLLCFISCLAPTTSYMPCILLLSLSFVCLPFSTRMGALFECGILFYFPLYPELMC
jgi:hypothetical protein